MTAYILLILGSVLISSLSQVVLKLSANEEHESGLKEYLNIKVILAYGMFFLSTILTMLGYRRVPLSLGVVLETTGYIYVAILGHLFLQEKITKRKFIGNLLIIAGIVVYSLKLS